MKKSIVTLLCLLGATGAWVAWVYHRDADPLDASSLMLLGTVLTLPPAYQLITKRREHGKKGGATRPLKNNHSFDPQKTLSKEDQEKLLELQKEKIKMQNWIDVQKQELSQFINKANDMSSAAQLYEYEEKKRQKKLNIDKNSEQLLILEERIRKLNNRTGG